MREVETDEQYFRIVNPRLPDFEMNIEYYVGGWHHSEELGPLATYMRVKLSPFETCSDAIRRVYGTNLHNLACGITQQGTYHRVVMSTIFHFSILDNDRIC